MWTTSPIIDGVGELAGVAYGSGAQTDMSPGYCGPPEGGHLLSDGALNEGRGYVLKVAARRCHGRLLVSPPFAETMLDLVVKQMQAAYGSGGEAGVCE